MAGFIKLRQALIDAKLSGTRTTFGYEFNSNEIAAARALDVFCEWIKDADPLVAVDEFAAGDMTDEEWAAWKAVVGIEE